MESELDTLISSMCYTRQIGNMSISNPEMLFNQTIETLKQYKDTFNFDIDPYFDRKGIKIIFKNTNEQSLSNGIHGDKENNDVDNQSTNTDCLYWVDLIIDDSMFRVKSSSNNVNVKPFLRDLNATGDLRSFLILLKRAILYAE